MPDQIMPVVIYSTPGCGRCLAAEEFFRAAGLEVEMVNVAGSREGLRRMAKVAKGVRTVPVLEYGQEVFVGFDAEYWRARLGAGA